MRPKLSIALREFRNINIGVSDVGTLIGGKVNYNINVLTKVQGQFENACAIRMSYVLNNTGFKIPYIPNQTVSGKNGNWYIYKVKTIIKYLEKIFGKPDHTITNPTSSKISSYKGIIVFEVDEWSNASGHVTIWDGVDCSDACYFTQSKKAYIWEL
jgi:hypothetical protein